MTFDDSTSAGPGDSVGGLPALRRWLGPGFRALRHRNYRLFFAGQGMSLIGTWMQRVALAWLVYELTGSKLILGVVGFAGGLGGAGLAGGFWGTGGSGGLWRGLRGLLRGGHTRVSFQLADAVRCGPAA